jgi:hypothetical protein
VEGPGSQYREVTSHVQHKPNAGAAEGCDLLIFLKQDQKIAAFGSSYRGV